MGAKTLCGYCNQKQIRNCIRHKKARIEICPYFEHKKIIGNHRRIMAEAIDRPLGKKEFVHHVNCIHRDNRLDNLFLCSPKEHSHIHRLMKKGLSRADAILTIIEKRKMSEFFPTIRQVGHFSGRKPIGNTKNE